jgi:hypothetical protein
MTSLSKFREIDDATRIRRRLTQVIPFIMIIFIISMIFLGQTLSNSSRQTQSYYILTLGLGLIFLTLLFILFSLRSGMIVLHKGMRL